MSEQLLDAALMYARKGWRVFPLHSIVNGRCTCRRENCSSPGKHPRTRGGFKDADTDFAQITSWWGRWPDANVGVATGSGLAVIDLDGPEGFNDFKLLLGQHSVIPETLVSKTGNGYHLLFSTSNVTSEVRSSARLDHIHVRGEGGYIVAPPSIHHTGRRYEWVKQTKLADLPDWLRQWTQGYEITANRPTHNMGQLPAHLSKYNQQTTSNRLDDSLRTVWSPSEQARLESALKSIPSDGYETWFTVGMALQALRWETNDSDIGFELWDRWSQATPAKYSPAITEEKWRSFGRGGRQGVTIGTVYHMAQQHGWNGGPPSAFDPAAQNHKNGLNGHQYALPPELTAPQPIHFPDVTEEGRPRSTMRNTKVAIMNLGVACSNDTFHDRMLVHGEIIAKWATSEISDPVVAILRDVIISRYGFDPKKENTQDALETLCLGHRFDPVCDYLDGLTWDGTPRLDGWLSRYLGAERTELNQWFGRLTLIAAVRRARRPGTKFDQILVLEGDEGKGKSQAIAILAGAGNFSDQTILSVDDRKQLELTKGVWLYEISDLAGMKRADVEHVKSFASRSEDRARPAYGRYVVHQARRCVFIGTTNRTDYLLSDTGNRRFWPSKTGSIDIAALTTDRDQLWAEAARLEAMGTSVVLPERLWHAAGEAQESRNTVDEWFAPISNFISLRNLDDVSVLQVLTENDQLQLRAADVDRSKQLRASSVLRKLGFIRYRKRAANGTPLWRYRRSP